jgi:hypothetical protein
MAAALAALPAIAQAATEQRRFVAWQDGLPALGEEAGDPLTGP